MCKQRIPLCKILIVRAEKPDNCHRNHFDVQFSPGLSYLQLGGGSRAISASSRWILWKKHTLLQFVNIYACWQTKGELSSVCNIFNGTTVVLKDLATGNRNYIAHPPPRWRCKELKMYFSQSLITFVFVAHVKQDNSDNHEFKDKPYDKWHTSRTKILHFKIELHSRHHLHFKIGFYYKIILSLASIYTQK